MQTCTFAWWRWRLTHAIGRNPLVRTSDRVEAFLMALAVAASLVAASVAGGIAAAVHEDRGRAYAAQVADREQIVATATADSVVLPRTDVTVVEARWQYGGVQHADRFQWDEPVRAGQDIEIWVHPSGRQAAPLGPWWRAGVEAAVVALAFWSTATLTAVLVVALTRPWLRRRRYAAWDREIASLADDGGTNDRHS